MNYASLPPKCLGSVIALNHQQSQEPLQQIPLFFDDSLCARGRCSTVCCVLANVPSASSMPHAWKDKRFASVIIPAMAARSLHWRLVPPLRAEFHTC